MKGWETRRGVSSYRVTQLGFFGPRKKSDIFHSLVLHNVVILIRDSINTVSVALVKPFHDSRYDEVVESRVYGRAEGMHQICKP